MAILCDADVLGIDRWIYGWERVVELPTTQTTIQTSQPQARYGRRSVAMGTFGTDPKTGPDERIEMGWLDARSRLPYGATRA